MGQDIEIKNVVNSKGFMNNPKSVYDYYFQREKKINKISYSVSPNLNELCSRFCTPKFKKALIEDNIERIKSLDFFEYLIFLNKVTSIENFSNFDSISTQIFNLKNINRNKQVIFYDIENQNLNNLNNNDNPIFYISDDDIENMNEIMGSANETNNQSFTNTDSTPTLFYWHNNIMRVNILDFNYKKYHNELIRILMEIENNIIKLIELESTNSGISLEQSILNRKWIIVYSLGYIRCFFLETFSKYEFYSSISHSPQSNKKKIRNLISTFFEEIGIKSDISELLAFSLLVGVKGEFYNKVLFNENNMLTPREIRIQLVKILYFCYEKKWLIYKDFPEWKNKLNDNKYTNESKEDFKIKLDYKKKAHISNLIVNLFSDLPNFSESNIRNQYLPLVMDSELDLWEFEIENCPKTTQLFKEYGKD